MRGIIPSARVLVQLSAGPMNKSTAFLLVGMLALSIVVGLPLSRQPMSSSSVKNSSQAPLASSASWNPATSCNAAVISIEQLVGPVPNPTQFTGSSPLPNSTVGADYSGGWVLAGQYPPGVDPDGNHVWPYSKRATNPPCFVTIQNGTVLPTLLEIHNVEVSSLSWNECGQLWPGMCDLTFNICNPVYFNATGHTCIKTYPGSMHAAHAEIDMAWNHSGIAPSFWPSERSIIDLQGFAYWDPDHVDASGHFFSGWEIHPVTAWRLSNPSYTASISFAPLNPVTGVPVNFTAATSGGTAPYTYKWTLGDLTGVFLGGAQISHTYINPVVRANVQVIVTDAVGRQVTVNTKCNVTQFNGGNFHIVANPSFTTIQGGKTGSSTLTLTSLGGFSGNLQLSATVSPPTGSVTPSPIPQTVALRAFGSATLMLNIATLPTLTQTNYSITVQATNGTLAHTTIVNATVGPGPPDFSINAAPPAPIIIAGRLGGPTVTLTSLFSYSGTAFLTVGSSTKIACVPANNSLSLSPGGSNTTGLTCSVPTSLSPGVYGVGVSASDSLGHSHSIIVNVTVPAPNYATTNFPTLSGYPLGSSTNSTLNILGLNGLTGLLNLRVDSPGGGRTPPPPDVTLTLRPTTLNLVENGAGLSTLTISVPTTVTPAFYAFNITGIDQNGVALNTTRFPLNIVQPRNFALSGNPSLLSIQPGSTGNSTITLVANNNFTGTVSLRATATPSGSTTVFNPASVTFTLTTKSATSVLTISTLVDTTLGKYNVNVTGTSAGIVHSVLIPATVARATTTSVSCTSPSGIVNQATSCTATATDTSPGTAITPSGTMSFTTNATGTFTPTVGCILSGAGAKATCSVSYTPGTTGTHTIGATYSGDSAHFNSSSATPFTVSVSPSVGGVVVPIDKLTLLGPFLGLASLIVAMTTAIAVYFKRRKQIEERKRALPAST